MTRKQNVFAAFLLFFLGCAIFDVAAQTKGETLLNQGITTFGNAKYDESIRIFRQIIVDTGLKAYQGDAYFWISKAYMALGQYNDADKNLEFFLSEYKDNANYPEAVYQLGRLLYLENDFQKAIQSLQQFIATYPKSDFVANAYFWVGESLYSLGQFDDAKQIFTMVVQKYPTSFKVEVAKYRISVIELKEREQELLKLLKWSHEEYLGMLDDFERRETSYEQALASYQRKLANLTAEDQGKQVQELNAQVSSLNTSIAGYKQQIQSLQAQLASAASTSQSSSMSEATKSSLEEIKNELSQLKDFYATWLKNNSGN